jgi:hypothetical protein
MVFEVFFLLEERPGVFSENSELRSEDGSGA